MPAFVFALAVLLLVGGLSWRSIDSLLATNALVTHTYTVLERLQSLSGDLRDAEAGEHSFVISGRDEFRAAYQAAVSRLPRHLVELRQLLGRQSRTRSPRR